MDATVFFHDDERSPGGKAIGSILPFLDQVVHRVDSGRLQSLARLRHVADPDSFEGESESCGYEESGIAIGAILGSASPEWLGLPCDAANITPTTAGKLSDDGYYALFVAPALTDVPVLPNSRPIF